MVKIAKKGSQDPVDSSLQMKVNYIINSDPSIPRDGQKITH